MTSTALISARTAICSGPKARLPSRAIGWAMVASSTTARRISIARGPTARTSTSSCPAAWTTRSKSHSRPKGKPSSPARSSISDSQDFHPTDVLEDADGSLLVVDTGGWYKLCCPSSQLAKPDLLGAIYRVRRKAAPKIADPWGVKLEWTQARVDDLVQRIIDPRP